MKKTAAIFILLLLIQANAPSTAWLLSDEKGWTQKRSDREFDQMNARYQALKDRLAEQRKKQDDALRIKYDPEGVDSAETIEKARELYMAESEELTRQREVEDDELEAAYEREFRAAFPERWDDARREKARKDAEIEKQRTENERNEAYREKEAEMETARKEWEDSLRKNRERPSGKSAGYDSFIEWVDKNGGFHREDL